MREPRNRDNGANDVWALTAYKPARSYVPFSLSMFKSHGRDVRLRPYVAD